jgi:tetratricopeptide (TPR) repeat protein
MSVKSLLFLILSLNVQLSFAENSCGSYLKIVNNPTQIFLRQLFPDSEILELNKIANVKQTLKNIDGILNKEPKNLVALKAYWIVSREIRANLELKAKQYEIASLIVTIEGKTTTNLNWLLQASMQSGYFKEAYALADELLVNDFGNVKYRVFKVEALMGQKLFFDALDLATEYAAIYPHEIRFLELAAKANMALGEGSRSEFHYKAAEEILARLTTTSNEPKAWYFYSLLEAKLQQGKFQEVLDYVEFSGYPQIEGDGGLIVKFDAYMGLKEFDSAEEIINKLLDEHPSNKRFAELRRRLTRAIKSYARGY